jgi:hypothetical protein
MVLVRPDGYVAWATDETAPPSRDAELHTALTRWCGQPDITGGKRAKLHRAHE